MRLQQIPKRMVLAVAVLTATSLTFAGCASSTDDAGNSSDGIGSSADYEGPAVEITYANSLFGNPKAGPLLEAMLDDFNKTHDNIKVTPAAIPFPTFAQTVLTQMGGGQGPDLVRFDTPEFYQAARAGLLTSLEDVIDAKAQKLAPKPDKFTNVDGTRFGVVSSSGSYTLLYNADLIETPPSTYDEFVAAAKDATEGEVYGLAFRQTLPEEPGMWQDLWSYVYGFGGSWSDGKELTLDSPKVLKGLTAFQDLYDADVIPKGATASTYRTMFAAGKVAMEIDNGGTADNLLSINPDLNLKAVEIPFPVKQTGEVLAVDAVNAAGKHQQATATFLRWLLTPDAQAHLLKATGTGAGLAVPVTRTAEDLETSPMLAAYDAATETAVPQIVIGFEEKTPVIRKIVIEHVVGALQGKTTMKDAMKQAQELATEAVGE